MPFERLAAGDLTDGGDSWIRGNGVEAVLRSTVRGFLALLKSREKNPDVSASSSARLFRDGVVDMLIEIVSQ